MVAAQGPLIIIVGETASGKSALAMELAQQFHGEIICADSRTVYRGLSIGTAKPSHADRQRVPHHMLDMVEPNQDFTAAEFKRLAIQLIGDITARGNVPMLVGGTGLYIDAILYDFQFLPKADKELRTRLEALSTEKLFEEIKANGLPMPENYQNRRHLIRTIEAAGEVPKRGDIRPNTLIMGIKIERDVLRGRITERINQMIEAGFIHEVKELLTAYGPQCRALQAPGYKAFFEYINGTIGLEEARQRFIQNDLQLAKRQRTWFKRNNSIHWLDDPLKAVDLTTTYLSKISK